jgi:hypothetical protein
MKCFVIMPFGDSRGNPERARRFELIYSEWIKPAVESITIGNVFFENIVCHRADKELRPEDIITHVIGNLVTADIVIADLSGGNPNVFYELGIRHAVKNNTILIAGDLEEIPFDLRSLRIIIYNYEPEHLVKLKHSLIQAIEEIRADPDRVDNPVRRFLYDQEIEKLIKAPTPPGYDLLNETVSQLNTMKKEFAEQVHEFRHIVKLITSTEDDVLTSKKQKFLDLTFFEGVWTDAISGSTLCARVIDGKLLIPYGYNTSLHLTGLFYDCKLLGDTIFARFKWFGSDISGYMFARVESENRLIGGWSSGNEQSEVSTSPSLRRDSIARMNKLILKRTGENKQFPLWAEDYLRGHSRSSRNYFGWLVGKSHSVVV